MVVEWHMSGNRVVATGGNRMTSDRPKVPKSKMVSKPGVMEYHRYIILGPNDFGWWGRKLTDCRLRLKHIQPSPQSVSVPHTVWEVALGLVIRVQERQIPLLVVKTIRTLPTRC